MKKRVILLIVLLLIFAGCIFLKERKEQRQEQFSRRFVTTEEASEELSFSVYDKTDWEAFFRGYHSKFLTQEMLKQLISRLGLKEYIVLEEGSKSAYVKRADWVKVYLQILDYLDNDEKVTKQSVLVMDFIEKEDGVILVTDKGDYVTKLPETFFEKWKAYKVFLMEENCIGMETLSDEETVVHNVYLKAYEDKTVEFLFGGGDYHVSAETGNEMLAQGVCDLTFLDGKLSKISKKEETIEGNLLSYDENYIEIDGYGRIGHTGKLAVYHNTEGEVTEASISDVVLGNRKVTYVIGEGEVCAILMEAPAEIENIRVLLLAENGSRFRKEVYLKADTDGVLKMGEETVSYCANDVIAVNDYMKETENTFILEPQTEDAKIYLCSNTGEICSNGYEGSMEVRHYEEGYTLVNSLPFEHYLYAVVPSEMPSTFEMEALKAQAVCARSYAYIQLLGADLAAYGAHIDDSTSYQVYNKIPPDERAIQAVNETQNQVMFYQGAVVEAYYFSTSMGYTDTAEVWNIENTDTYGYLKKVCLNTTEYGENLSDEAAFKRYITSAQSGYDSDIKYFRWSAAADYREMDADIRQILENRHSISAGNVIYYKSDGKTEADSMEGFGEWKDFSVEERSSSGFILTLKVVYENGVVRVKSEYNIRKVLGCGILAINYADKSISEQKGGMLPSAACTVEKQENGTYVLYGGGFGHGLGMSQNGANGLAKAGQSYQDILKFFYKDIEIQPVKGNRT